MTPAEKQKQRRGPSGTEPLEEQFGRMLNQLGEGVVVSNRDEFPLYVNQAMAELLGYTREELMQKRSFDLVSREELELLHGELKKRRRGKTSRYNLTLLAKTGERVPVQVAASPLSDGGTVAIFVDLRERLRQQEALKELQAQDRFLASILQDSVDAIVSLDSTETIRGWNRGAELVFGYRCEEILGKSIKILHPPDTAYDKDAEYVMSQVREKGYLRDYQTQRLAKGGRAIPVSITVSAVRGEGGKPVGLSVIYRDISALKKWEKEVAEEFQRLNGVYRELGRKGRQLESVLAMIELLQGEVTTDTVTSCLASHLAVMTSARVVLVSLITERGDELQVSQAVGAGKEWQVLPNIPLRDSIFEECLRRGAPHRVHDISASPGFHWRRLARKHDLRSALLLPLFVGLKRYGVVTLYFTDDHPYRNMHESYPEHLAQVGAVVLHLSLQRELQVSEEEEVSPKMEVHEIPLPKGSRNQAVGVRKTA